VRRAVVVGVVAGRAGAQAAERAPAQVRELDAGIGAGDDDRRRPHLRTRAVAHDARTGRRAGGGDTDHRDRETDQGDARRHAARPYGLSSPPSTASGLRRSFPDAVRGSDATKVILFGTLNAANSRAQWRRSSSSVTAPRATTSARTS